MRKSIKLSAAFCAAAVTAMSLAIGSAALAQEAGWAEEDGNWKYYDADGYSLTDSWKKYGNDWYYLDEDGNMAVNRQINEYYTGADGKRVQNQWVEVANDDDWDEDAPEKYWYYYTANGQMAAAKFKEIDGVTYYFDEEGRMATGLTEIDGASYYFSASGAMKKGWIQLPAEGDEFGDTMVWAYFDSRGRRIENQIDKKINGAYYTFENGVMVTGWYKLPETAAEENTDGTQETAAAQETGEAQADSMQEGESVQGTAGAQETANEQADSMQETAGAQETAAVKETTGAQESADSEESQEAEKVVTAPAAGYQYYEADGRRASGWLTVAGIPRISAEDETYRFYFKGGVPHYSTNGGIQIFGIGSDRYAFNDRGEMQTGLTVVTLDDGSTANYYFAESGAMKTGKQTIYSDDTEMNQVWYFQTDGSARGQGFHGIHANVIYEHGMRLEADSDLRYAPVTFEGTRYLVNASGTIQKASASSRSTVKPELGSGYRDLRDANDTVWTVNTDGIVQ